MKKEQLLVSWLWVELVQMGLFTEQELQLLTDINGYTIETLNDAIYSRYGYRDYEQIIGERKQWES